MAESDDFQKLRTCQRCGELKPASGGWLFRVCPDCVAEALAQPLRRCSRCGFHRPDWQTTAAYCPQCWREYQRERRARLKEEGQRQWTVKACSKCGATESMPPDNAWCRQCRNSYQRRWKRDHPNAHEKPPQPPQPVTGREPLRTCAGCKRRLPYNRETFKRGNICRTCYAGYHKTARANQREREAEWRENATPVECRTCHQVKEYGKGWDGRLCPQCQAIRAAKAYAEIKANPQRLKHRKAQQESARQRRIARKKDVLDQTALQDAQDAPTPVIAPQVPSPRDSDACCAYVLNLAAQGQSSEQIRDLSGYALGQIESYITADRRRRECELEWTRSEVNQ